MITTTKKKNSLIKHTISGVGAGCVSTLVLYPLDLVKIHFQVSEQRKYSSVASAVSSIYKQGGIRALYRGMSPALYGSSASWGLYFMFYEHAKNRYIGGDSGQLTSWHHFISGIEAGAMCIPFTNPIWLIKVRMQVQAGQQSTIVPYTSVTNAFRRIVAEEGALALYKGAIPALFLTTHGAFKFVAYEKLKTVYYAKVSPELSLHHTLAMGSIAQAFASFMTYPYQVIKARIQQGGEAAEKYKGTIDCGKKILKHEGALGFYKGIVPNIMRVMPSGAISFAAYEKISSMLSEY